MHIIPVIDLKDGIVVHAKYGNRSSYQAIHSLICRSANPQDVIDGFLALYPFNTIYVADLDSLSCCGNNLQTIISLLSQYPKIQFLIDRGILCRIESQLPHNWTQVIGTESLTGTIKSTIASIQANLVLSLDFNQSLIGIETILDSPDQWPEQVIAMTLNKVGSNTGPDWNLLWKIKQLATHSRVIAAGGIRDTGDLIKLSNMGIHSALVASSLHTGQLNSNDLNILSATCQPGM